MEQPHNYQRGSSYGNTAHHDKANGHQNRYGNHNTDFGFPDHSSFLYIAFQIVLIKLRINKPVIQSL